MAMKKGTKVKIKGLVNAAIHNGKIGIVVKEQEVASSSSSSSSSSGGGGTTSRLGVKLLDSGKILAIKMENLEPITIETEAIAEFDLIPLDDGTTKSKENSWTEYLALRRRLQGIREKSYYADEDGGAGGYYANEDDDDAQRARRKVQEFLDGFLDPQTPQKSYIEKSGTIDTNLVEDWKKGMYLEVSAAHSYHSSYDDDDGFQQLAVRTTFFSPVAVPRAVEVEMVYQKELYQEMTVKLLSFDPPMTTEEATTPAKKKEMGQTIVSIHLAPKRKINVKNLNEKMVTQICKHLEIHTDTKTSNTDDDDDDGNDDDTAADSIMRRYILMKLLLSINDYVDGGEAGFYAVDTEKIKDYLEKMEKKEEKGYNKNSKKPKKETNRKNNDDTSDGDDDDDDASERLSSPFDYDCMTWLDYHIRVATNYVKPYYSCLKFIPLHADDDLVDACDYWAEDYYEKVERTNERRRNKKKVFVSKLQTTITMYDQKQ